MFFSKNKEAEQILDQLLEMPETEWFEKLTELAEPNTQLYADVKKMLHQVSESGEFMGGQAAEYIPRLLANSPEYASLEDVEGRIVGPWKLMRKLGAGGMGVVFEAKRNDGAFDRTVALKYVRSGLDTGEIRERFAREQRILGMLKHPGLAQLYDSGIDENGTPYFVMEFVDGKPITEWIKSKQVTLKTKLQTFLDVCEAVHYAHRNLIIHRDLKPSNIFIDQSGKVRLLDFGIAKIMDESHADYTVNEMKFMSVAYAAPEQLLSKPVGIATDVYSLGVILFELFTGVAPYVPDKNKSLFALQEEICNGSVPQPSRFKKNGDQQITGEQSAILRGDLDNIVMKAMQKDPADRYDSVKEFANDIRYYLENKPIKARSAGIAYRARKFVKRNFAPLGFAALLIISAVSALIYHNNQLRTERAIAEEQAARAVQVSGFLIDMFQSASPAVTGGETLTAKDLLEEGMLKADAQLAQQPELAATFYIEMGKAWEAIGDYPKSLEAFEKALEIRRELLSPYDPELGEALRHKGMVRLRYLQGETPASEYIERALEIHEKSLLESPTRQLAKTYWAMGMLSMSRQEWLVSADFYQKAADVYERLEGRRSVAYLDERANVADALGYAREFERAIAIYDEVLPLKEELQDETSSSLITTYNNLGMMLDRVGRQEEASRLLEKAFEGYKRIYGDDHLYVGVASITFSANLRNIGLYEKGLDVINTGINAFLENVAPNHPYLHTAYHNKGRLMVELNRSGDAEFYFRKSMRLMAETAPPGHFSHAIPRKTLSDLFLSEMRLSEAREILEETVGFLELSERPNPRMVASIDLNMGRLYYYEGNYEAAIPLIESAVEAIARMDGSDHPEVALANSYLERLNVNI
ncbi:MAG: protein kinase [Balneolales bacterium]|nr:protein kinase [Balneolales bacterium]